jgi:membrane protein implicated in regulation of membrane protease activity
VWEWTHAVIGGVATAIFLIQALGNANSDSGMDGGGDADGSLSDWLSVHNFVAFFIGYGWMVFACLATGVSRASASFWGMAAGVSFAAVSIFLVRIFVGFQEDGSVEIEKLVGETASVYIAIGASLSAAGKVMVDTRKGRAEIPARTEDPEPLRPGQLVRIQKTEGGVLWVTKI